ncbi:hypothetical protein DdX_19109 [Ditylenchus destructor]|uniref:F-box domain-containing protein n=1 Tax=Ditylenchus destructor TaxID=166010 RepID=A0AAD4MJR0_9BILA|nr:hypothetical protein DdX_19109 [Ditylenchus destructor]
MLPNEVLAEIANFFPHSSKYSLFTMSYHIHYVFLRSIPEKVRKARHFDHLFQLNRPAAYQFLTGQPIRYQLYILRQMFDRMSALQIAQQFVNFPAFVHTFLEEYMEERFG